MAGLMEPSLFVGAKSVLHLRWSYESGGFAGRTIFCIGITRAVQHFCICSCCCKYGHAWQNQAGSLNFCTMPICCRDNVRATIVMGQHMNVLH